MRILFAISCFEVGGTEHHALKAMRALEDAGHEVAVIVGRAEGELLDEFRAQFRIFTYHITSLTSPTLFSAAREIRAALDEWKPDVVHSLDKYSNVLLLPIARLFGSARVVGSKRWFRYVPKKYHLLNVASFKFAHVVTANGAAIRDSLIASDGVPAQKATVIWNIIEEPLFVRPELQWLEQRRRDFALPDGAPVVGMVARFNPIKDHATFVRSMALVIAQRPDAIGVCVGDGAELQSTKDLALQLGIPESMRFVGYQPNS
ncbi:MAG: glycosyltransferase, partial [Fuerstia sp.]|nr:glycosyltransferase [Fuerstiella sp.]